MKILWWIQLILATVSYVPDECADANIKVDEDLLPRDTVKLLLGTVSTAPASPFKILKNADNENQNLRGQIPWIKRKLKSDLL